MKAVFTLFALAGVGLASKDHFTTLTTYVSTTVCPVTSTKYEHGTTAYITKLTTSTITLTGLTTVTVPGVAVTSAKTDYYTTYTTECDITETKTLAGSTIIQVVPRTSTVTKHLETVVEVFVPITISSSATVIEVITLPSEVTKTQFSETLETIKITSYSTTEPPTTKATLLNPITLATSETYVEVITLPSESTEILPGSTIYSTIPIPITSFVSRVPSTTSIPTLLLPPTSSPVPSTTSTPTALPPPTSTSAPTQVTGLASANNIPVAYAIIGAMALLALA